MELWVWEGLQEELHSLRLKEEEEQERCHVLPQGAGAKFETPFSKARRPVLGMNLPMMSNVHTLRPSHPADHPARHWTSSCCKDPCKKKP